MSLIKIVVESWVTPLIEETDRISVEAEAILSQGAVVKRP